MECQTLSETWTRDISFIWCKIGNSSGGSAARLIKLTLPNAADREGLVCKDPGASVLTVLRQAEMPELDGVGCTAGGGWRWRPVAYRGAAVESPPGARPIVARLAHLPNAFNLAS